MAPRTEPQTSTRDQAGRGIAVLGGAFNPPHTSHQRLCRAAFERLPIATLHVIPAGDHPHKRGHDMASAADRMAMCRLAFADDARVIVDDRELRRPGRSFTVDTLREIAAENPGRELFFLIGSDNLPLLPTWRDHHTLLASCTVVTYPRKGHPIDPAVLDALDLTRAERERLLAHVLPLPADDVAASDLRRRWRAGERSIPEIPAAVRDYLAQHRVYG